MARTSAAPASRGRHKESAKDSARDGNRAADGTPRAGERIKYACPVCGDGAGDASYKPSRYGGLDWLISCWSPDCQRDRRYLPKLGDALGLGEGATKEQIVSALRAHGREVRRREAEPLPSLALIDGWHARLMSEPDALGYLERRGVSRREVEAHRIGFDGKALTFPMFDGSGDLAAFKRRPPRPGAQMLASAGPRDWPLYPPVRRARGWTLLLAGELDALAARSAGLPASSVTVGAPTWREEWTAELAGLRVVVCFDNNEASWSFERVAALQAAGIDASRIDLRRLGLRTPKGDVSDYLNGGGDPARLRPRRRIVRRNARRAA